jgi:hypothetical protein
VKRHANGCLADAILHDVRSDHYAAASSSTKEHNLKAAYACFLRLNCPPNRFIQSTRSWRFQRTKSDSSRVVAECLTEAYLGAGIRASPHTAGAAATAMMDWSADSQQASALQLALDYCQKAFPNLSGSYVSKKAAAPAKKKRQDDEPAAASSKKSFDVQVPKGSKPGDSFVVGVQMDDGCEKKVRLKVPDPVPTVMRFSLPVAASPFKKKSKP